MVNWYQIIIAIIIFVGLMGLFFLAYKKGWLTSKQMSGLSEITSKLEVLFDELSKKHKGTTYDIANLIITFVNKAVSAAENAWYHDEITKEERKEYSINCFKQLLAGFGLTLSEEQWSTIDILITAFCEEMGHTVVETVSLIEEN